MLAARAHRCAGHWQTAANSLTPACAAQVAHLVACRTADCVSKTSGVAHSPCHAMTYSSTAVRVSRSCIGFAASIWIASELTVTVRHGDCWAQRGEFRRALRMVAAELSGRCGSYGKLR
jgi:hypothetical protein